MNSAPWKATVFTLYPEAFPGVLGLSVIGRGLEDRKWELETVNIRDFALDKHQTVDDAAFGGGPGMVMRPDVLDAALTHTFHKGKPDKLIYLSPRGQPLTQAFSQQLASYAHVGFICGRFEGIDQRILETWVIEEVSLGDFILAGGEVAAQALIESVVRLLPGVLGAEESLEEESFSNGLLEHPQYTRPREWKGLSVPEVLLSGHHGKIKEWRKVCSEKLTQLRRPDLWERYVRRLETSLCSSENN